MPLPRHFASLLIHPSSPLTSTLTTLPLPSASSLPPFHVLIRVHAAASNPKDYLHLTKPFNSGDDLAGIIVALSPDLTASTTHLKIGDRVAAFHQMQTPYGAYAEYAVAPAWTTFRLPPSMTWEEAATIPLVAATAAVSLFRRQGLASPWEESAREKNGQKVLLVYGASSALGAYSIKLAKLAGVKAVIAIGGGSSCYVKGLLGEKDAFLDYREGMQEVKSKVRKAVEDGGWVVRHAIDCVGQGGSWVGISQMMDEGVLSVVSGKNKYDEKEIREDVKIVYTYVGTVHTGKYLESMPKQPSEEEVEGDVEFVKKFFGWVEEMLEQGKFEAHPFDILDGGLDGVATGLNMLKDGEAKGKKFVYSITS